MTKNSLKNLSLTCFYLLTAITMTAGYTSVQAAEATTTSNAQQAPAFSKEVDFLMKSLYGKTGILYLMNESNERDMMIGSQKLGQTSMKVPHFSTLKINVPALVTLEQGATREITVIGEDNIISVISAISDREVLTVSSQRSFNTKQPLIIKITAPSFGIVQVNTSTTFLQLANLRQPQLSLVLLGHIKAIFTGQISQLDLQVKGIADINARNLQTQRSVLKTQGKIALNLMVTDTITAEATGNSHLNIYGEPPHKNVTTLGLSTVNLIPNNTKTKR